MPGDRQALTVIQRCAGLAAPALAFSKSAHRGNGDGAPGSSGREPMPAKDPALTSARAFHPGPSPESSRESP